MSLATVYTRASAGIDAPLIAVEAHLANGLPSLSIVGLPEAAVKESKDRVRSAIINCQFEFPLKRITINLAPADLPKDGGRLDLAIAMSILVASGQVPADDIDQYEFLGELSLSGTLRPIHGALPASLACSRHQRTLCLPRKNAEEASRVRNTQILAADHLLVVCAHLNKTQPLNFFERTKENQTHSSAHLPDFSDVIGQAHAKRALEIAAAGRHNLLMLGPPGTGKSMLASRLPSILPLLSEQHAIESASVFSVSKQVIDWSLWRSPPFRSPHHTASSVAMVGGGGNRVTPGEISLAHLGVLFLDELPEFDRRVLEALREPLENGSISISRAQHQTQLPANFQLIAAMNPCPCGLLGDPIKMCQCSPTQLTRYRQKISGPLLDRIDMHIEVPRQKAFEQTQKTSANEETSKTIALRVNAARKRADERQHGLNSDLPPKHIQQFCALNKTDSAFLQNAIEKLGLSHRAHHRILRVARTIADLDQSNNIELKHLTEALSYRRLDRQQ